MWKEGSLEVAPYLTKKDWEQFVQLAAKKLNPNGHMAVMIGQSCFFEMADIIRKHFNIRWIMAYVHGSGAGTPAREAYIASHWRPVLLCRRKDAPPFTSEYTQYVHDLVPAKELISLPGEEPQDLISLLQREKKLLDRRIACLEATGKDSLSTDSFMSELDDNDSFMSELVEGYCLKLFHPWEQDKNTFRHIIQVHTKPGDYVWDCFIGSGTTGIAAVTCQDWLFKNGKKQLVLAPRRGMGCDFMKLWANIAKRRVWEAQHGGPDSFEELEKAMSADGEKETVEKQSPQTLDDSNEEAA
jgi:hypothetical protein